MRSRASCVLLVALVAGCSSGGDSPPPAVSLETTCADALAAMRMPFAYQLPAESGVQAIRVRTEGGTYREMTFGPWGAHASPHTGHTEGNAKADMLVPYSDEYADLTYIPDPIKSCDESKFLLAGEVQCGLASADVLADRVGYVAPGEGWEVVSLYKEFDVDFAESYYAFDTPQWKLSIRQTIGACNVSYAFGHIAWLGPTIIAELESRGIDWQNAPIGENLSDFENPIPVAAGDVVAYPQIVGRPTALSPDYVVPHDDSPSLWTQVEFFVYVELRNGHEWQSYHVPAYRGLSSDEYAVWSTIFQQNVLDPANPRYGTLQSTSRQWLWAAESELLLSQGFVAGDKSSLVASLGSWFEGSPSCGSDSTQCDEMVTFFPIYRDTALFAGVADHYDPDSRYMVGKVWGVDQTRIFGEVLEIRDYVDGTYLPVTTLDTTLRGALVVRFHDELSPPGTPVADTIIGFQSVAYDLDPMEGRLVLQWGAVRDSEALAAADIPPTPPTQADSCTGESHVAGSTTCHHKLDRTGWVSAQNVYP